MRVFGLTGGIASGKSTVAERFRQRGLPTVDADVLARRAVEPGSPGLQQIVAHWGPDFLTPDGRLDRQKLGAHVFGNPAALARLNSIVHPQVGALLQEDLRRLQAAGHSLVCYEVPLLFENDLDAEFRPVVLVAVPPNLQRERAMARHGWTRQQAQVRIDAQLPLEAKRQRADFVIDNSGSLEHTWHQADRVLEHITRLDAASE